MVHNYQENCILECSRATDSRSDFFTFFCNVCPQGGVDLYGDGELIPSKNYKKNHMKRRGSNLLIMFDQLSLDEVSIINW